MWYKNFISQVSHKTCASYYILRGLVLEVFYEDLRDKCMIKTLVVRVPKGKIFLELTHVVWLTKLLSQTPVSTDVQTHERQRNTIPLNRQMSLTDDMFYCLITCFTTSHTHRSRLMYNKTESKQYERLNKDTSTIVSKSQKVIPSVPSTFTILFRRTMLMSLIGWISSTGVWHPPSPVNPSDTLFG